LLIKATRRDAIANLKGFWGPWTPATQFRWFHWYSLCGTILFWLMSFRLAKFGWAPFADFRVRRLARQQNAEFTEDG